MTRAFAKMHGFGNDFVVFDATREPVTITPERARLIADRRFGIGCDQILVVEPARTAGSDFGYRILNADGSESGQCGNGARCFARFVRQRGLCDQQRIKVDLANGSITIDALGEDQYRAELGVPAFDPADVPLRGFEPSTRYTLNNVAGQSLTFAALAIGNPHAIVDVDDIDTAPVETIGQALQNHDAFPERVNVSFVQTVARDHVRLRVFERGAGQTLACGSAACATVVAGIAAGRLDSPVDVALPGGTARVHWAGGEAPVALEGPAAYVFDGSIIL